MSMPMSAPSHAALRFDFGANWRDYLRSVDDERVRAAMRSLTEALLMPSLEGRGVLDIGCGSGLFSLAALRLGAARVHAFDFDPDSVRCAESLKAQFAPEAQSLTIERGDVLDRDYVQRLGRFDVVYSWGVLHHTGRLWDALENAGALVAPGGLLAIAIYNDQGIRSRIWREVKRVYNQLPAALRTPWAVAVMLPHEARGLLLALLSGAPSEYVRSWTRQEPLARGMSRWHDLIDWVGGYPFEVATPEAIFNFYRDRGFRLRTLKTRGGSFGCNEFGFERAK